MCNLSSRQSNSARRQIAKRLGAASRILVVTHARPDPDCLGSMVALAGAARDAGKTARMFIPDAIPDRYRFIFPQELPCTTASSFDAMADQADVIVIVDTCAFAQLDDLEQAIKRRKGQIVVLDHHATHDDVGAVQWIDTTAAASGIMAGELLEEIPWPISLATAQALLMATASDTGWFRFANTDARCLRAAAKWLDAGVKADELYRRLNQTDRPERLALTAKMLQSLQLYNQGRLALMVIRKGDFEATGAAPDETENLVNEPLRIGSVEAVVLLVENEGQVRASLRSRELVDVAQIARQFGGGGHARASGLRSTKPLDTLKKELLQAFAACFGS